MQTSLITQPPHGYKYIDNQTGWKVKHDRNIASQQPTRTTGQAEIESQSETDNTRTLSLSVSGSYTPTLPEIPEFLT
jgi:hypothetical protein